MQASTAQRLLSSVDADSLRSKCSLVAEEGLQLPVGFVIYCRAAAWQPHIKPAKSNRGSGGCPGSLLYFML